MSEPPARLVLFACTVALWADGQLDASVEASGSWAVGDVTIVIDYLSTKSELGGCLDRDEKDVFAVNAQALSWVVLRQYSFL